MKSFYGILILVCLSSITTASLTEVIYQVQPVSDGRWQYTYEVQNISFAPKIEQFTIWFELGLYDNIQVESPAYIQAVWSEIFWQPEPLLLDDGAFDAKTLTVPILIGNSYSGFSVSFDWLGLGTPGSQYYEVINPNTFMVLTDGYTLIPEPATLLFLSFGGLFVLSSFIKVM